MQRLLEQIQFRLPERARRDAEQLLHLPSGIQDRIRVLLASLPDPDESLQFLERLQRQTPAAFTRITTSVTALRCFLTLASYSTFLAEAALRRPEWLLEVTASTEMHRVLSAEEFEDRLEEFLRGAPAGPPSAAALAHFRRRQLLRIVLRDVLGFGALADITEELSNLASAILELACRRLRQELVRQHGTPRQESPDGKPAECGFAVIALGKLGGRELNYSSDIDLMFLYGGAGRTDGPSPISNKQFFEKLGGSLVQSLSAYTGSGVCYRVDLRLRPDGRLGEIAVPLDGARAYYETRARDWELQMLIKARVVAGDRPLGKALLDFVQPLIYRTTLDFSTIASMADTRDRVAERLAQRRAGKSGPDIKLARGGIRDIEFLVQCLQRLHGGREPWVRQGGTLFALHRLRDKDFLSDSEYGRLASAYQFLRHLEHRLQFQHDRQIHALPADPADLEILARKMPLGSLGVAPTAEGLRRQVRAHTEEVQELYDRVIHAQQPMYYDGLVQWSGTPAEAARLPEGAAHAETVLSQAPSNLTRYLDQRAPKLALALAQRPLERSHVRFEHFLEKVFDAPAWVERLNEDAALLSNVIDLFEHSQYFADQLIRDVDLLEELSASPAPEDTEPLENTDALRRRFRRRMLRIQARSVCGRAPIFSTLAETSELADLVIRAAYRLALDRAITSMPPAGADYRPCDQMVTIALGRLGMREFDLASDADLIFVIPDQDGAEHPFWTRVAERMVNIISAYTGDGVIFSVDTRLRPNGREGDLVQTQAAYKNYFAHSAEAWEGITYMKSRAVAGNVEWGTEFLHDLQEVDWRRYGQALRSRRQLAEMRARLESEQGARNPLKAGRGGYYDIDFVLMYLRLKGAGIFYKVLNTPERIDVIEKMGHLDPEEADFLRDAATFYRAIDHGLRIWNGQPEGELPTAPAQLEVLTGLVKRWTPEELHERPLPEQLALIRTGTRAFFDRIFR